MNTALVSIIIPSYNHAQFLKERLDSILGQTYQDFELIILDDASTDGSETILKKYKDHPKVSHYLINEENSGNPSIQWKKGLELAKGEFIWIAESDDFCDLNFLETQIENLDTVDVSVARTIVFSKKEKRREIQHPAFKRGNQVNLGEEDIYYCPILNVSAVVFKSSLIRDLSSSIFDKYRIIGDRVFYFEFFHNVTLGFNPKTYSYFRQEDGALSNLESKSLDYLKKYFKEHVSFIFHAVSVNKDLSSKTGHYIDRFFNRVRNRVSRRKKVSPEFLSIYLYYLLQKFKIKIKDQ